MTEIIAQMSSPPDGTVLVPDGTELQFWVNEGQPAIVGDALTIVEELQRNPTDFDTRCRR